MTLTKKDIDEIKRFIVGSSLEMSLINQSDMNSRYRLKKWLEV